MISTEKHSAAIYDLFVALTAWLILLFLCTAACDDPARVTAPPLYSCKVGIPTVYTCYCARARAARYRSIVRRYRAAIYREGVVPVWRRHVEYTGTHIYRRPKVVLERTSAWIELLTIR